MRKKVVGCVQRPRPCVMMTHCTKASYWLPARKCRVQLAAESQMNGVREQMEMQRNSESAQREIKIGSVQRPRLCVIVTHIFDSVLLAAALEKKQDAKEIKIGSDPWPRLCAIVTHVLTADMKTKASHAAAALRHDESGK